MWTDVGRYIGLRHYIRSIICGPNDLDDPAACPRHPIILDVYTIYGTNIW